MDYSKGAILSFSKEYRFLSNFFPCNIIHDDLHFPSTEHYYQALKTTDYHTQLRVSSLSSAADAKDFGKKIMQNDLLFRDDWEDVKLKIMTEALLQKFAPDSTLAQELINTNGYVLIEGNYWGDNYWGVDYKTGVGENKLGILLMRIRHKLIHNHDNL